MSLESDSLLILLRPIFIHFPQDFSPEGQHRPVELRQS